MMEYELDSDQRIQLLGEMLSAAASSGAQTKAIMTLAAWYEGGKEGEEPDLSGWVTWKMECAISSDLAHIFRAKLPEGTFGSQYDRQYVRIRQDNAARAARRKKARAQGGMSVLRDMLTI